VEAGLPRAVQLLERSIGLDSIAGGTSQLRGAMCRLCEALRLLADRYRWADSIDGAERILRRWTKLRSNDNMPWGLLADLYVAIGRQSDANAAMIRYEALGGSRGPVRRHELYRAIMSDDVEASLVSCTHGLLEADPSMPLDYTWLCEIALRAAGRYRDARALLVEGRIPGTSVARPPAAIESFGDAILDYETGHFAGAARKFRRFYQLGRDSLQTPTGIRARNAAWALALAATANVAAGDTARARRRADTLESVGQRSWYPRDRRLHHFIRGLLLARAGKLEEVVSEYRAATSSPTYGYTRINLELGRALLALGRPSEGIAIVRAGLRGGIDGSNLYVSRTELHELLAQLFDAARQRDSAVAHYTVVEHAWRGADPMLKARYDAVAARLTSLVPNAARMRSHDGRLQH
jgi:predicted Zn-dependent protease